MATTSQDTAEAALQILRSAILKPSFDFSSGQNLRNGVKRLLTTDYGSTNLRRLVFAILIAQDVPRGERDCLEEIEARCRMKDNLEELDRLCRESRFDALWEKVGQILEEVRRDAKLD